MTRSEMRRERVDLSALAEGIAEELQRAQPERRVEFVVDLRSASDSSGIQRHRYSRARGEERN